MRRPWCAHQLMGTLAVLALLVTGLVLPSWRQVRAPALVEAARTFELTSSPGYVEWSTWDGLPARGPALVTRRLMEFERSDLVEIALEEGVYSGVEVREGQPLARLRSPGERRRLAELEAERQELSARKALLLAGGPPEQVEAARRELELAQAASIAEEAQLQRVRALASDGVLSQYELETAEVRSQLLSLEVEVARAAMQVSRSPARPEALRALDARLKGIDAYISELEERFAHEEVRSPMDGVLGLGRQPTIMRVHDISVVYLQAPLPLRLWSRVRPGDPVTFSTTALAGTTFEGRLVDVGEEVEVLDGTRVFWASSRVENPDWILRPGMGGTLAFSAPDPEWWPPAFLRRLGRWGHEG